MCVYILHLCFSMFLRERDEEKNVMFPSHIVNGFYSTHIPMMTSLDCVDFLNYDVTEVKCKIMCV